MRMRTTLALAAAAIAGGGCVRSEAKGGKDTLVIELGGPHEPLSQALVRLGLSPPPEDGTRVAPPAVAPDPGPRQDPSPENAPPAPPAPPPQPQVLEVRLEKGETVYELAKKHLGSAVRWREIADFNGWGDAQCRRLRAGTVVRIPLGDKR